MSNNNNIVECVFDIYFESDSVAENFLGQIERVDDFKNIIQLPLCNIPTDIRRNDPNFKNQSLYEISSDTNSKCKITLGDNVVGIIAEDNNSSWSKSFFPQIEKIFFNILGSEKISKITRMGLRYISFLEKQDIFSGDIKVSVHNKEEKNKSIFLKINDKESEVSYDMIITNKTHYKNHNEEGSIIDITTSLNNIDSIELPYFLDKVKDLQKINKKQFRKITNE